MKAVTIARQGDPVAPNIELVTDLPDPTAGPDQVVVRTEATALNHLDLWAGRGLPGLNLEYPKISGSDGCGIVEAVGDGVDDAWLGRRVVLNAARWIREPLVPGVLPAPGALTMIGEHDPGTHRERFVAPVSNIVDVGEADPAAAAAFGLSHLTAWGMLVNRAGLQPGQWVLITGIGGGVALAALNIARWMGCRTIVTSRHQWKLDRALELGAEFGVLDEGEDWSRTVRGLTGKRGVDVCADSVGPAIHNACIRSLARRGTFVTCGSTTQCDCPIDLTRIFWNELSILGSSMGDMNAFRSVLALLADGTMTPVVDSTWNVDDASSAWERLESGDHFGKIVLNWN
ncbi:MAG: zinc-binding dehydrogenase [Planctomycetota bacterium]|nr:zinc-binding dehydrogenase [Planctomycetota bacterium]